MSIFPRTSENTISSAILEGFVHNMQEALKADVFVIGAGPAGLTCARKLAEKGVNVFVVENNNYLGGGFWLGGYFMNTITVRAPGQKVLEEIGVPMEKKGDDLYTVPGPLACASTIAAAAKAGVKFMQLTYVEDLVVDPHAQRVTGVVINWSPVKGLPKAITCVDPIALEAPVVIDATGHDAVAVQALAKRGLVEVKGMGALHVTASEDAVVEHTREVYPGLLVAGMAAAETFGLARMGPTFGAMLLSGERAAEVALQKLAERAPAPAQ